MGWLGGAVPPPAPAWQPGAHRWQRLGSRRGGICAFAPAAHGALPGTGRSELGGGGWGGSRPARLPVATRPGGSGVPPGDGTLSRCRGQPGCGGMRVGITAARGALARGHPQTWEGSWSPRGAPGTSSPAPGYGLTPRPPTLSPTLVRGGLGPAGILTQGHRSRIWPRGARAEGPGHPTCTPPRRAGQRIPGSGGGCSRRSRKRPLDFITHFLTWLPGDKRLEETGFHFPPPQQGASAPPRAPL